MYNICLLLFYLNFQSERKVIDQINFVFILIYGSIESWVELIVIESMYEVVFVNFRVFYKYDFKQFLFGGWSYFFISLLM